MSEEIKLKVIEARKLNDFDRGFLRGFIAIPKTKKYYPKIVDWLDNAVLRSPYKTIIVASTEKLNSINSISNPLGVAIIKPGKICHCSVNQDSFYKGIGTALFALALKEAIEYDCGFWSVRFTLPSVVWEEHKNFFKMFGFNKPIICKRNYRPKVKELRFERKFK